MPTQNGPGGGFIIAPPPAPHAHLYVPDSVRDAVKDDPEKQKQLAQIEADHAQAATKLLHDTYEKLTKLVG